MHSEVLPDGKMAEELMIGEVRFASEVSNEVKLLALLAVKFFASQKGRKKSYKIIPSLCH